MPENTSNIKPFHGFSAPNYTQVPDELFDDLMTDLSGAELKVLLYIIRRTFGFKKLEDNISINQMLYGITTKEGETLDKGTGLSKKTLLAALKVLVERNIIVSERRRSVKRGNEPTTYKLNMLNSTSNNSKPTLGVKSTPPLGGKITPRASSKNSPIQETVLQETDLQFRNSNSKSDSNISNTNKGYTSFKTIGELLKKKKEGETTETKEVPEALKATINEISKEFGEHRNSRSNLTHAIRIYQKSGKKPERFTSYLYEARSITKQQGSVKKRMPYFFKVLEDITGLQN